MVAWLVFCKTHLVDHVHLVHPVPVFPERSLNGKGTRDSPEGLTGTLSVIEWPAFVSVRLALFGIET